MVEENWDTERHEFDRVIMNVISRSAVINGQSRLPAQQFESRLRHPESRRSPDLPEGHLGRISTEYLQRQLTVVGAKLLVDLHVVRLLLNNVGLSLPRKVG